MRRGSAPASSHIPAGVRTVKEQTWRNYAYKLGISDSEEPRARQQAFRRAHEHLIAINEVAVWDGDAWATK
jgi:hypothetical protein